MQEARYKPSYFIQLEVKIRRFGNKRVARAAPTERRECEVKTSSCGFEFRSGDAQRCD